MAKDILLNDENDLLFKGGDLAIGDSTLQHQRHLFLAQKGSFKQSPVSGIGITDSINDDDMGYLYANIQKQFELDGMEVNSVEVFTNGKIKTDADYRS